MSNELENSILIFHEKGMSYSDIAELLNLMEIEVREICMRQEKEEQERKHKEELDKEIEEETMRPLKKTKVM